MNLKRFHQPAVVSLIVLGTSVSQGNERRLVNEFLHSGLGVRAQTLGPSFVAVADDVSAVLWNPAGLAQNGHNQLETTFRSRLDNFVRDQSVALALPAAKLRSVFGFGYLSSQIKDVTITPELTAEQMRLYELGLLQSETHSESVQDMAFLLSWGLRVHKNVSVGLTGKVINRDFVGNIRGVGHGADLGFLFNSGPLALGAGVRDVVGDLHWKGNMPSNDESVNFRERPSSSFYVGTAYFLSLLGGRNKLVMSLGGHSTPTGFTPGLGAELRFQNYQVRLGAVQDRLQNGGPSHPSAQIRPSLGLGLALPSFQLQYAVTQHTLGFNQGFSVGFQWGRAK